MSDNQASAPPQYSPDGRWWWNGQQWVAVPAPAPSVIVRNYQNQAVFAADVARMAAQGYHIVSQVSLPPKRQAWEGWGPFSNRRGLNLVVTYQAG